MYKEAVVFQQKENEKQFFLENRQEEKQDFFLLHFIYCVEIMSGKKTSDFYWACHEGDVDTVMKLLPKLSLKDINRIESNGSTALHAASYFAHASIVRILLDRGADTTIHNKYDRTAKQEAANDEIRALFELTTKVEHDDDENDDTDTPPQSEFAQLYANTEGREKPDLATRIFKARRGTYQAHQYTISATSNIDDLEVKYYRLCETNGDNEALMKGKEYFNKYREKGDFNHMIKFYTAVGTPFYNMAQYDETFLMEMYKYLSRYDTHAFGVCTYRGSKLQSGDLAVYRWAYKHRKNSLLETRKLLSTTSDRNLAVLYTDMDKSQDRVRVMFEYNFNDKRCFTALDLKKLSAHQEEKEVLILSGTLFEVTDISKSADGFTVISLNNLPVDASILSMSN
jgi:hypothetical protein